MWYVGVPVVGFFCNLCKLQLWKEQKEKKGVGGGKGEGGGKDKSRLTRWKIHNIFTVTLRFCY